MNIATRRCDEKLSSLKREKTRLCKDLKKVLNTMSSFLRCRSGSEASKGNVPARINWNDSQKNRIAFCALCTTFLCPSATIGEQDIRTNKIKQKISGCFKTKDGGVIFCRIRSYISTATKQGWRIWDSLVDTIRESLRLPDYSLHKFHYSRR